MPPPPPPQEESKCTNAQFLQWILKRWWCLLSQNFWGNSFIGKNIGFLHNMLPPQYCVTGPRWVNVSRIKYLLVAQSTFLLYKRVNRTWWIRNYNVKSIGNRNSDEICKFKLLCCAKDTDVSLIDTDQQVISFMGLEEELPKLQSYTLYYVFKNLLNSWCMQVCLELHEAPWLNIGLLVELSNIYLNLTTSPVLGGPRNAFH